MTLANSSKGFSCGEVSALFHPYRIHHLNFECGCGQINCDIWKTVRKKGKANAYKSIFELFPEVEFIIDSSKNPLWIHDQTRILEHYGIEVKNVLLWKTPQEFLTSRIKRDQLEGWERAWLNYYRFYFKLIKKWHTIKYVDLVTSPEVLGKLCCKIEIPYFEGKQKFWVKEHHTLFGNSSAKVHLYSKESDKFDKCMKELHSRRHSLRMDDKNLNNDTHRTVYYNSTNSTNFNINRKNKSKFNNIQRILSETDFSKEIQSSSLVKTDLDSVKMPCYYTYYRKVKRRLSSLLLITQAEFKKLKLSARKNNL